MADNNVQELAQNALAGVAVQIGNGYVSSYTGPEMDAGLTKAYEAEYLYCQAEEVSSAVDAVRSA